MREFENLCLLKAELENRGYSVEFTQAEEYPLFRYKYFRKPRVIIHFCLYSERGMENLAAIVGKYRKILNMQWEQVTMTSSKAINFITPKGKAKEAVHVCWGETSYNRLIQAGVKNAKLLGAIQLDFLRKPIRNYYYSREEIDRKYGFSKKKMILYISSFATTNLRKEEVDKMISRSGEEIKEYLNKSEKNRRETLVWLEKYLSENEDYYLIYRPHPYENVDSILDGIKSRCSRFFVITDYSVRQWILVADEIFTMVSTAITEVYYSGKNCRILRPIQLDETEDISIYKNADVITSYEEFKEKCGGNNVFPIDTKLIEANYGDKTNSFSFVKICDLLEEMRNTSKYDVIHRPHFRAFSIRLRRFIKDSIYCFHITENTWPFSRIKKAEEWLRFYYYYKNKMKEELVSREDILSTTNKLKDVIKEIER